MTRIGCETAAQCQRFAEATHEAIEPAITVALVAVVLFAAAMVVYRGRKNE